MRNVHGDGLHPRDRPPSPPRKAHMLLTTTARQDTPDPRLRALRDAIGAGRYVVDPHAVAEILLARPELALMPVRGGARTPPTGR